jgi:glycosyltransferase involved in cell wall biosynthesis
MSNVLFVGPYRQNDGWGNASREYLRALRKTGCNLAARPIYLNYEQNYEELTEFEDLEEARFDYDVIVQNCIPHQFRRYGGVKNIGLCYFETCNIAPTPWPLCINQMDEMWVCSEWEKQTLIRSGVTSDIKVVRIPVDHTKYDKEYEEFEPLKNHKDEFKFYFLGEYIGRKDVQSLLLAYHREFRRNENVRVILKINKIGVDAHTLLNLVSQDLEGFKSNLKLYPSANMYNKEIVIPTYLSEDEMYGLHKSCDCFVMPSSGEAFCMPAFDAMMFGNAPIVNKNSSMIEYLSNTGFSVESHKTPAVVLDRPLPYLYTGKDEWYQVDVIDLQKKMREAYEQLKDGTRKEKIRSRAREVILPNYTYDAVAKQMKELVKA